MRSEGVDSATPPGGRSGFARATGSLPPMSCAANATAAARFPTPGGPWKRYACAGPSASAARSSRFASACSGKLSNASTYLLGDLVGRPVAVYGRDALGIHRCEGTVRLVDRAMEVLPLALDPVRRLPSLECDFWIDHDEEGPVWQEPTGSCEVELEHALETNASRKALVGERRVDVPVADDRVSCAERRSDHTLHELGTGGCEQRGLPPRAHLDPVEQKAPDLLAEQRAPWLTGRDDLAAVGAQSLGEQVRLRGLAGTVHAFEGDEQSRPYDTGRAGGRYRRSGLHRLERRRCAPCAGRRGARARRPLARQAGE